MTLSEDSTASEFHSERIFSSQILPREGDINDGDIVLGFSSSGIHSNGYSLVRKVVERSDVQYGDPAPFDESKTLGQILLTPTRIYIKMLLNAVRSGKIKALAHITGGGLTENIPRVLSKQFGVFLDAAEWCVIEVHRGEIQRKQGHVSVDLNIYMDLEDLE